MEENTSKIKNIKSKYILRRIFTILVNNRKLDLIIYNKALQKIIMVDIEDYKRESGRIKKMEDDKNMYGYEYKLDTDLLIFEGEYLQGKKNGKGKEYYYNGKLKYEGEYLNGKKIEGIGYDNKQNIIMKIERNGKGKEYYNNGKIQFEGDYYNGRRWNGKGYNYEGKEEFIIEYGKGKVKEYYYDGKLLFEGEYLNGKKKR